MDRVNHRVQPLHFNLQDRVSREFPPWNPATVVIPVTLFVWEGVGQATRLPLEKTVLHRVGLVEWLGARQMFWELNTG